MIMDNKHVKYYVYITHIFPQKYDYTAGWGITV